MATEELREDVLLNSVYMLAEEAHRGQVRKYRNEAYIQHPLRVMRTCRDLGANLEMLAAALLHDVVEDTDLTEVLLSERLGQIFAPAQALHISSLVKELTDVYVKADYPRLNRYQRKEKETERLAQISAQAQTIKYADILDNASDVATADPSFARVLLAEYDRLLVMMQKGDRTLKRRAQGAIDLAYQKLGRP
jgi:(p)ppGpp synthase/HD superfamily hydrolase